MRLDVRDRHLPASSQLQHRAAAPTRPALLEELDLLDPFFGPVSRWWSDASDHLTELHWALRIFGDQSLVFTSSLDAVTAKCSIFWRLFPVFTLVVLGHRRTSWDMLVWVNWGKHNNQRQSCSRCQPCGRLSWEPTHGTYIPSVDLEPSWPRISVRNPPAPWQWWEELRNMLRNPCRKPETGGRDPPG